MQDTDRYCRPVRLDRVFDDYFDTPPLAHILEDRRVAKFGDAYNDGREIAMRLSMHDLDAHIKAYRDVFNERGCYE